VPVQSRKKSQAKREEEKEEKMKLFLSVLWTILPCFGFSQEIPTDVNAIVIKGKSLIEVADALQKDGFNIDTTEQFKIVTAPKKFMVDSIKKSLKYFHLIIMVRSLKSSLYMTSKWYAHITITMFPKGTQTMDETQKDAEPAINKNFNYGNNIPIIQRAFNEMDLFAKSLKCELGYIIHY